MTKRTVSDNDDDDGNKNGRKVIGLERYAFLYIFSVVARVRREGA